MQGIVIFMTSDGFRVSVVENYESLFDGYANDMIRYVNLPNFQKVFGNCKVMSELEARGIALSMAQAYNELPDGIRTLTTYRKYSFEDIMNGKASENT
jgi:hypothetical protein